MTEFEKIKVMNIDEFAEWFDDHCAHDGDPCVTWWNNTYCANCEPIKGKPEGYHLELDFAWCELYEKCKFFQDMERVPNTKEMTKLWLESEESNE